MFVTTMATSIYYTLYRMCTWRMWMWTEYCLLAPILIDIIRTSIYFSVRTFSRLIAIWFFFPILFRFKFICSFVCSLFIYTKTHVGKLLRFQLSDSIGAKHEKKKIVLNNKQDVWFIWCSHPSLRPAPFPLIVRDMSKNRSWWNCVFGYNKKPKKIQTTEKAQHFTTIKCVFLFLLYTSFVHITDYGMTPCSPNGFIKFILFCAFVVMGLSFSCSSFSFCVYSYACLL